MLKFLVLSSYSPSLRNFRGPLITELAARGHDVHVAAPRLSSDARTSKWLAAHGIERYDVPFARTGLNPVSDLRAVLACTRLMRRIRPDVFLGYTIKPVIWGIIAAWLVGVPRRVALITGLGYAFTGQVKGKRAIVQKLARALYARAMRRATLAFFQNPDDLDAFRKMSLLSENTPTAIVNGSGVDTDAFLPAPFPQGAFTFLLIARLLGDKGIREYVAAARAIREQRQDVEFHLVGGVDPNPDGIAQADVQRWHDAGHIVWLGPLDDVRPAIAASHAYVLPSYREGMPRTVLEAMAMGRPIITTDAPGCRETVTDGENGFLVPVRDSGALAQAMRRFLEDPSLIPTMGQKSYVIVRDKYDANKVNAEILKAIGI